MEKKSLKGTFDLQFANNEVLESTCISLDTTDKGIILTRYYDICGSGYKKIYNIPTSQIDNADYIFFKLMEDLETHISKIEGVKLIGDNNS